MEHSLSAFPCRIVGFEELEGGDDFSNASLELTMIQCGKSSFVREERPS